MREKTDVWRLWWICWMLFSHGMAEDWQVILVVRPRAPFRSFCFSSRRQVRVPGSPPQAGGGVKESGVKESGPRRARFWSPWLKPA